MEITLAKNNALRLKGRQALVEYDQTVEITRADGTKFSVDGLGEYEAGGVSVVATIGGFVIEIENLRVCVLDPKLTEKLTPEILDEIGAVDITVSPNLDLAKQTDPWVAITATADPSLPEPVLRYIVTADKLPSDLQVVVLVAK